MARKKTIIVFLFFILAFSQNLLLADEDKISLDVVGDIMCHDIQYQMAFNPQTQKYDFLPALIKVKNNLNGDLRIGNLETTFSGADVGYSSYPTFNTPDELADALKAVGFDLLFTANNHSLDKGEYGLKRTLDVLDKLNFLHTGTYKNDLESESYSSMKVKGNNFGFLNYTYGTNGLKLPKASEKLINYIDYDKMKSDIEKLRPLVDTLVVGIHFGNEYELLPNKDQLEIVEFLSDLQVDLVLGSHPHVLQKYDFLNNKQTFVVYSLGNFLSAQKGRYKDCGAILHLDMDRKFINKKFMVEKINKTPVWVRRYRPSGRLQLDLHPYINESSLIGLNANERVKMLEVKNDADSVWKAQEIRREQDFKILKDDLSLNNILNWSI